MKRALALLGLALVGGCTFPNYDTRDASGGGGGNVGASAGVGGSGGTSGLGGGGSGMLETPTCDDNKRNGDETGIDCGMAACSKPCPPGQGCDGDPDCAGGKCQDKICRAPSCGDGLQNNGETDKDCGGDQGCARCTPGLLCSVTSDCDGGACAHGQCQAPTCKDSLLNGAETDIDCGGGTCGPCEVGGVCLKTDDCDNVLCSRGKCQAAACDDKLLNQDETDTDCGGSCEPCADTLKCKAASDCASGVCTKALLCAAPTCTDKVKNGNEPGVDCGGSCSTKCGLLGGCNNTSDCAALSCVDNRCLPGSANGKPLSPVNWTATASDTYYNSDPLKGIDGVKNTFWTSGTTQVPKMWFAIDLAAQQVFFSIEIDCFQQAMDFPTTIDVWLSDDPTFPEPPVETDHPGGAQIVVNFTKAQAARYVKISLTQGGDHWWSIDEVIIKQ